MPLKPESVKEAAFNFVIIHSSYLARRNMKINQCRGKILTVLHDWGVYWSLKAITAMLEQETLCYTAFDQGDQGLCLTDLFYKVS